MIRSQDSYRKLQLQNYWDDTCPQKMMAQWKGCCFGISITTDSRFGHWWSRMACHECPVYDNDFATSPAWSAIVGFFWNVSRRPDDLVEITSLNLIKARRIVYVVFNLHSVRFYERGITILLGGHNSQIYYQYQSQVKQSLPSFEDWFRNTESVCTYHDDSNDPILTKMVKIFRLT